MTDFEQIELEQGSQAWHDFRRSHCMASNAAIVMGCAPSYWQTRTRADLRAYDDGVEPQEPDDFTRQLWERGHRIEADVRRELSGEHFANYEPVVFKRGKYGASLDGWCGTAKSWIEVKAPKDSGSRAWVAANAGERPPAHYWWQLVHQAYCVPDDTTGVYYVVRIETEQGPRTSTVLYSREELLSDWPQLERAWESYLNGEDFTGTNLNEDEQLAARFRELEQIYKRAKDEHDAAKAALLAGGPRVIPGICEIKESSAKGRIDYRKAAESVMDAEALEKWRGEPTTRMSVNWEEA